MTRESRCSIHTTRERRLRRTISSSLSGTTSSLVDHHNRQFLEAILRHQPHNAVGIPAHAQYAQHAKHRRRCSGRKDQTGDKYQFGRTRGSLSEVLHHERQGQGYSANHGTAGPSIRGDLHYSRRQAESVLRGSSIERISSDSLPQVRP